MTKKDFQFFAELFADHAMMSNNEELIIDCIVYFKREYPRFNEKIFWDAMIKRKAKMLEE
jgi:hypothetical protein